MENLQILPKKEQKLIFRSGCDVLWMSRPTLIGDTPAARHTAALIEALWGYGENTAANGAEKSLKEALASGRLFDFKRHTFEILLSETREKKHLFLTLTARFSRGNDTLFERTLSTCWDEKERFQRRPQRVRSRRREH